MDYESHHVDIHRDSRSILQLSIIKKLIGRVRFVFCWTHYPYISTKLSVVYKRKLLFKSNHVSTGSIFRGNIGTVELNSLMPGSDGRQESFSRRDFHSFSFLVAAARGENEWKSRRDKLSCLPSEPGISVLQIFLQIDARETDWNTHCPLKMLSYFGRNILVSTFRRANI